MNEFVLDTSVILKWFSEFGESDLDCALQLRQAMLDGLVVFIVPELMFYELSNALRYHPNLSSKEVVEALNSVLDMGFDVRGIDKKVMGDAIYIAFKYNITAYDAYFVALSKTEGKPFITADYKFVGRVKEFKEIVKLSDIKTGSLFL